jgi:DNA-binding GntR family transcriptional regulator
MALTARVPGTIACDHASDQCSGQSSHWMSRRGPAQSKKERIYRTLRQDILTLALRPGAVLVESALSRRFAAGRTTVREALALLQQDGLIAAMPRRGYLVAGITVSDVQELFEVRLILESAVAQLAASRITPEELAQLAALADPLDTVIEPRAMRRFLNRNREFHLGLARATRNARLVRLVERTLDEMTRMVAIAYQTGEHAEVVEALRSGDDKRAASAMANHVLMTRERVFKRELSLSSDSGRGPFRPVLARGTAQARPHSTAGGS